MALWKCGNCKARFAPGLKSCPHCETPTVAPKKGRYALDATPPARTTRKRVPPVQASDAG